MKLPLTIDTPRMVPFREKYPFCGRGEDNRPDRDRMVQDRGSVTIVPDDSAKPDGYPAMIQDADGKPLAWYSGCGSHGLTITESLARLLRGELQP